MMISLPSRAEIGALVATAALPDLMANAAALRDAGFGRIHTYSPKVFIPLTHLCRDVCHYCTFAHPPKRGEAAYLSREQVLDIARAGAAAGCTEALFTLGDKPELRYAAARTALAELGHETTLTYLAEVCELVLKETGLLPHVNAGVMDSADIAMLRHVSASQGLMLESASERLCEKGGPHYGSPDKVPARRLETIAKAGELQVPFTSGILIGIGETRDERIDALVALRDLHAQHGHIQEIIIQNFRAKPDTKMAGASEPDLDELLWTIAVARLIFGAEMSIQAPPNLSPGEYGKLIDAGINDWGGVSPVTLDHVNPEAPWPHLEQLRRETARGGKVLAARLPVYPAYLRDMDRWLDSRVVTPTLQAADGDWLARMDAWAPGITVTPTLPSRSTDMLADQRVADIVAKAFSGEALGEDEIVALFRARGADFELICEAADALRAKVSGDVVTYVVNRNINYTNICGYKCRFCAFSKGKTHEALRGLPYDLDRAEVIRRAHEAWERGATEVCMQGGIHPDYTGNTYLGLCRVLKDALPDLHIHAFSPLEVQQGAATLGLPVRRFLEMLKEAGLGTLPGTAAEILDEPVRQVLCPDKLNTDEWLSVVETAHEVGFRTTSTIMFGHIDGPENWARHILRIRAVQERTGGFTEFVPLPFVHMEAPLYLKGRARKGPTFREAVLMHAVARLAFHPVITNIQVSWVKLGRQGLLACLNAGANDLGGTLMNESISRAAGTEHGQELPPDDMDALIRSIGRVPRQRTTLYGAVSEERQRAGRNAAPLAPVVQTPPRRVRVAAE
ncbi:MAG TPA: 5-amino-6-(D-ribitylamino)uracil--L-tyrosine 4-hydroxyphenyl transferase CofH [Alphaproteobacteria bacterium]|nr:5-amino-6-(D-ribitylamino)uracil--L-tyrosine 4-hydroxyphenyl transferase CofH [Alphaproteobacteria bacterium]